jgi:hypothetical protein
MSKRTAIKVYCRECAGGSYPEVLLCHLTDCPLWPYRTGYSAAITAKSAQQALIRHPDIAKELAELGVDVPFSLPEHRKQRTWRGKSERTGQTTGVNERRPTRITKRKEHSGDALTGVQVGPLEAQDERRHT